MEKGEYLGICNMSSCKTGDEATWYNHGSLAYYCPTCAARLNNDEFNKRDAQRLFGHELCTEGKRNRLADNQKEEILDCIMLRRNAISVDPSSADEFETEENLNILKDKIESNVNMFNEGETGWMMDEILNKIQMYNVKLTKKEESEGKINSLEQILIKIFL